MTHAVSAERLSDTQTQVKRRFAAPPARVFAAWSKPELFRQWWLPQAFGMTMIACDMDVRTGGSYRLEIGHPDHDQPMAFFGRYLEVVTDERIVWTNEEGDGGQVTTVTFARDGDGTLLIVTDSFPTKEALDAEIGSGAMDAMPQQLDQLDSLLAEQPAA